MSEEITTQPTENTTITNVANITNVTNIENITISTNIKRLIGEILVDDLKISKHYIEEGLTKQIFLKNKCLMEKRLGEVLVEEGLVPDEVITRALAIQYNMEYFPILEVKHRIIWSLYKQPEYLAIFDETSNLELKEQNSMDLVLNSKSIPGFFDENGNFVLLVTDPLLDKQLRPLRYKIKKTFGEKTKEYLVNNSLIEKFKAKRKQIKIEEIQTVIDELEKNMEASKNTVVNMNDKDKKNAQEEAENSANRKLLQYLFTYAIIEEASDIHVVPNSKYMCRLAVRVQGILETVAYISLGLAVKVLSTLKTAAVMKPEIKTKPQDGRIDGIEFFRDFKIERKEEGKMTLHEYDFSQVAFRVSTYPLAEMSKSLAGIESCVLRVLNMQDGVTDLTDLGLSPIVARELEIAKDSAQGLILITGPTGSGKSTTIYSLMSRIDGLERNIMTFEDPVEMRQMNWRQGQKKGTDGQVSETNFTYDDAIKAIVRHDPEVILLGEIRDTMSAEFALKSANTGHLVFATLHANNASLAFERLNKIGIEYMTIASSLLAVTAQRLVRKACTHCSVKVKLISKPETMDRLNKMLEASDNSKVTLPEFVWTKKEDYKKCKFCNGKGYVGRIAITEIIPVRAEIRKLIAEGHPAFVIEKALLEADNGKYKTILFDGLDKAVAGETTIEEVLRVL